MIPVTKPFLPPKANFNTIIDEIWDRNWLTNNGPVVLELEQELKNYLNLDHLLFTSNGTIALQMAIKALNLSGEIITTPFSYVATTSCIVWENCKPIFADILEDTLTIDPEKIKKLINIKTSAILATHVYGIPCDVEAIEKIANEYNLKVIYDGAHAFGVNYKNKSLLSYGDISTLSTHATKLYHTIEGGAVMAKDSELIEKLSYLRNFGHDGFEEFNGVGINGKNSEFHAAMGLANIKFISKIIDKRKQDCLKYDAWLLNDYVIKPLIPEYTDYNYSYYPAIFETEEIALKVYDDLNKNNIFARRYFYPSLSHLDYVEKQPTPISDSIACKVLCLPLYFDIKNQEIDSICKIIINSLKS